MTRSLTGPEKAVIQDATPQMAYPMPGAREGKSWKHVLVVNGLRRTQPDISDEVRSKLTAVDALGIPGLRPIAEKALGVADSIASKDTLTGGLYFASDGEVTGVRDVAAVLVGYGQDRATIIRDSDTDTTILNTFDRKQAESDRQTARDLAAQLRTSERAVAALEEERDSTRKDVVREKERSDELRERLAELRQDLDDLEAEANEPEPAEGEGEEVEGEAEGESDSDVLTDEPSESSAGLPLDPEDERRDTTFVWKPLRENGNESALLLPYFSAATSAIAIAKNARQFPNLTKDNFAPKRTNGQRPTFYFGPEVREHGSLTIIDSTGQAWDVVNPNRRVQINQR